MNEYEEDGGGWEMARAGLRRASCQAAVNDNSAAARMVLATQGAEPLRREGER